MRKEGRGNEESAGGAASVRDAALRSGRRGECEGERRSADGGRRLRRRGDAPNFQLPNATWSRPPNDVTNATSNESGANRRQNREALSFHVGAFWKRNRVCFDLARAQVFELDGRIHGDNVGRKCAGI